jgi:hypothetical protein
VKESPGQAWGALAVSLIAVFSRHSEDRPGVLGSLATHHNRQQCHAHDLGSFVPRRKILFQADKTRLTCETLCVSCKSSVRNELTNGLQSGELGESGIRDRLEEVRSPRSGLKERRLVAHGHVPESVGMAWPTATANTDANSRPRSRRCDPS